MNVYNKLAVLVRSTDGRKNKTHTSHNAALMQDGGAVCAKCLQENYRLILRKTRDYFTALDDGQSVPPDIMQWAAAGTEKMSGTCDHCGKMISGDIKTETAQHGADIPAIKSAQREAAADLDRAINRQKQLAAMLAGSLQVQAIWPDAFAGNKQCRVMVRTVGATGEREGPRRVIGAYLERSDGARFDLSREQYNSLPAGKVNPWEA